MNYLYKKLFVFGEILFDIFDDEAKMGGAPFNVACNLRMLGEKPLMVSCLGADRMGGIIRNFMDRNGMERDFVGTDPVRETGQVLVNVTDGEPSYEIKADQAYDYIPAPDTDTDSSFIYYGTLAARSPESKNTLLHLLKSENIATFYDVNLRRGCWDKETVGVLAKKADNLKLNMEELETLSEIFCPDLSGHEDKCRGLMELFGIDRVYVTCGADGAFCVDSEKLIRSRLYPVTDMKDTVGAGDAFSSVIIGALINEKDMDGALNAAAYYASAVCSLKGAVAEDSKFYKKLKEEMNALG